MTQPWALWSGKPKRVYAKGELSRELHQCPHSCSEPRLTHTSTEDPPTLTGRFGSVFCRATVPFLWVLVGVCKILFVPSKTRVSLFPQSCESLIIKFPWPSRSDSLAFHSFFVRSPGWEAWCGVPNLHNSRGTSLELFSSLWVTHPVDWDLILSWLCPSYHLAVASSLSMDVGYLFLVGSSVLLSMVVQ